MRSTATRHTAAAVVSTYPAPRARVPEWRRRQLAELAANGGHIVAVRVIGQGPVL